MPSATVNYGPTQTSAVTELCYASALGIMNEPRFACRNYRENNCVLIYATRSSLFCEQGGQKFVLDEGKYLLLDKRITHSYYFDPEIPSEILWTHINGSLANRLIAKINSLSPLPFIGSDSKICEMLTELLDMHESGDADAFETSARLSSILHTVLKEAYSEQQKTIFSSQEFDFRARIENIFYSADLSKLTLEELSRQMQMNKYYFSHNFKKYYGASPIKYVQDLKLEKAKYLLSYSDIKISAVAQKYGFSSHAYFSSAFKKQFGVSPEDYRKSLSNERKEEQK